MNRVLVLLVMFTAAALAACRNIDITNNNTNVVKITQGDTSHPGQGATGTTIDIIPHLDSGLPGSKTKAYAIIRGNTDKRVAWESKDQNVITVPITTDTAVDVSYIAPGVTNLCATSIADPTAKTCVIRKTLAPPQHVDTTVVASPSVAALYTGSCGANSKTITWATSPVANLPVTLTTKHSGVVTVDQQGKITALKAGTDTVVVTVNGTTAHFDVIVPVSDCATPPSGASISLSPAVLNLTKGSGCTSGPSVITATVVNATAVTWSVSGPSGVVTTKASGLVDSIFVAGTGQSVVVTGSVTGADGVTHTATSTINVTACNTTQQKPALEVIPLKDAFYLGAFCSSTQEQQLYFREVFPDGSVVTQPVVNFSTSPTGIVSVTQTGMVHPLSVGTTSIKLALQSDTSVKTSIDVTVQSHVCADTTATTVGITPPGGTISVGQNYPVSAVVASPPGMNHKVTWSTSNGSVLTVTPSSDTSAVVTGAGVGSGQICASWDLDPTRKGCQTFTVQTPPTPVVTPSGPATLVLGGGQKQYTATVTDPATGQLLADQKVIFSSSDPSIVLMNGQTGMATPIWHGSVKICAQKWDNAAAQGCMTVTVP